jgi:hypothetical protein
MRKYILINIGVAVLGLIFGLLVWMYLYLFPVNSSEFNMFAYYIDREDGIEKSLMSTKKSEAKYLVDYYNERKTKSDKEALIKEDKVFFFIIPLNSKVKVIDTISSELAKVKVMYSSKNDMQNIKTGYIPLNNLHIKPPLKDSSDAEILLSRFKRPRLKHFVLDQVLQAWTLEAVVLFY